MATSHVIESETLQEGEPSTSHTVASLVATDEMSDDPAADQSKRVLLPANCVVILNGQKCQLRINEESGALVAYPIKEDEAEPSSSLYAGPGQSLLETSGQRGDISHENRHLPQNVGMEELVIEDVDGHTVSILDDRTGGSDHFIDAQTGDIAEQTVHVEDHLAEDSVVGIKELSAVSSVKLAVPKLIIPSVGGRVTSLAITQQQVTGVTKIDATSSAAAIGQDDDTGDDELLDPKLTVTNMQTLKPVLKQFLISPPESSVGSMSAASSSLAGGDDLVSLGIKTSGSDLAKLKCDSCHFQAYYPQQYEKHLKEKHGAELHSCKCCTFVCLVDVELVKHYTDIHPRNICDICHHVSVHAYIIKRHMYRHTSDGCHCEICGKVYKDQYILKMHHKMVHTPAEVLYQCDLCSKKFTRKAHLKRHYRTHNPEKAFSCPKCDYKGCERSDVTKHMLIHETPKLVCEVCGKTFRHQKNKALHMKRHAGQRDFKCGVCDFFGYTFTDIRKHIERRHTEWKPVVCDKCGHAFKSEFTLQEHMKRWHKTADDDIVSLSVPSSAAVSGGGDGDVMLVSTSTSTGPTPSDHTLILNADGTMLSEEQVIAMSEDPDSGGGGGGASDDDIDDNVIEFIATGVEGSSDMLGQFTTVVTSEPPPPEHQQTTVAVTSLT